MEIQLLRQMVDSTNKCNSKIPEYRGSCYSVDRSFVHRKHYPVSHTKLVLGHRGSCYFVDRFWPSKSPSTESRNFDGDNRWSCTSKLNSRMTNEKCQMINDLIGPPLRARPGPICVSLAPSFGPPHSPYLLQRQWQFRHLPHRPLLWL